MLRLALVTTLLTLVSGCSNVLGYDDVTFDDGSGGAGTSGGGGALGGGPSGGGSGAAASGGSAGAGGSAAAGGNAAAGGTSGSGGSGTGGTLATGGTTGSGGATSGAAICSKWKADRGNLDEGTWSGSVASCNAGDIGPPGRENALRLVNLYRHLVGLPAVTTATDRDQQAQACALMMHANGSLSHTPPTNWACYSADGASAAGKSNIASTAGVRGVDLYIADPGNATTMGHRRWILSNTLGPIGLGSTSNYSCMWVIGGAASGNNKWTAFPPPGPVPADLFTVSWASVDSTGWTIQSDTISLAGAQVTVTSSGQNLPVTVTQLQSGYGSKYAISLRPSGWTSQAGNTYSVSVTGLSEPIQYDVEVISCN